MPAIRKNQMKKKSFRAAAAKKNAARKISRKARKPRGEKMVGGGEGESVTVELGYAEEIKNIELDEKLKGCLQALNACFWKDGKDSIKGTLTINFNSAADVADQAAEDYVETPADAATNDTVE